MLDRELAPPLTIFVDIIPLPGVKKLSGYYLIINVLTIIIGPGL